MIIDHDGDGVMIDDRTNTMSSSQQSPSPSQKMKSRVGVLSVGDWRRGHSMHFPMKLFLTVYITTCLATLQAFNPMRSEYHGKRPVINHDPNRRRFILQEIIIPLALVTSTSSVAPNPALADPPLIDKSSPDVPAFKGDATEAKKRFQLAMQDIDSLIANYDEISKSGGDNVRLYLGTQGVKSNMYGIVNVLKSLKEEAEDIVEYTEALNEFEAYLFQADGAAYQSLFAEFSTAKITPESLMQIAKGDINNMRKFMGDLALQLSIDAR